MYSRLLADFRARQLLFHGNLDAPQACSFSARDDALDAQLQQRLLALLQSATEDGARTPRAPAARQLDINKLPPTHLPKLPSAAPPPSPPTSPPPEASTLIHTGGTLRVPAEGEAILWARVPAVGT
eukprot:4291037-Prymnesium_polylepis.1